MVTLYMQQTGYPGQSLTLRVRWSNGIDKMMLDYKELPDQKIISPQPTEYVVLNRDGAAVAGVGERDRRVALLPAATARLPIIAVRGAPLLLLGLGKVTVDIGYYSIKVRNVQFINYQVTRLQ